MTYEKFATQIRREALRCINSQGSGHVGGSLSIADVLAVDPNLGLVVACADMEQDTVRAVIPTLRKGQLLAVPNALAEICVTKTRKHAFSAKGYGDL